MPIGHDSHSSSCIGIWESWVLIFRHYNEGFDTKNPYLMVRAAASGWEIWWICRQSVTLFWLVINRNKRTSNMVLHFFYFCAKSCLWIVRNGLVSFNWILCEMWSVIMIWDKLWWRAGGQFELCCTVPYDVSIFK